VRVGAYFLYRTFWRSKFVPLPSSLSQPVFLAILGLGSAGHHGGDSAPVLQIAGKAAESVAPTTFYAFTPTVIRNTDRPLRFSIQNKPSWASFGARRGTLYGVPSLAYAGTVYSNIRITVSDGSSSVTLPAFSITVEAPSAEASKTSFLQSAP
jgi:hypothetical protein